MIAPRTVVQITLLSAAAALVGCASAPAGREADETLLKDPLLSQARVTHEVVPEAFITALTPSDKLDSPASWMSPDGRRWVIATAKGTHALVVFDGDSGKRLRVVGGKGKALGKLDRPNGISVVDDLVFVVERDNRRVQVFTLPDLTPVKAFGQSELREPYGLWVRKHDGGYEVVVSDNYMSSANKDLPPPLADLGQRFRRYQLNSAGQGWQARLTQSFGDTSEAGAVRIAESVFGDEANARLMIAEEDVAVGTQLREYGMDGRYRGRNVGAGLFKAQAEGISLFACSDGSGYWIATDQFKDRSVFQVFDRKTLAHVGAFAGRVTANTDGVAAGSLCTHERSRIGCRPYCRAQYAGAGGFSPLRCRRLPGPHRRHPDAGRRHRVCGGVAHRCQPSRGPGWNWWSLAIRRMWVRLDAFGPAR